MLIIRNMRLCQGKNYKYHYTNDWIKLTGNDTIVNDKTLIAYFAIVYIYNDLSRAWMCYLSPLQNFLQYVLRIVLHTNRDRRKWVCFGNNNGTINEMYETMTMWYMFVCYGLSVEMNVHVWYNNLPLLL